MVKLLREAHTTVVVPVLYCKVVGKDVGRQHTLALTSLDKIYYIK